VAPRAAIRARREGDQADRGQARARPDRTGGAGARRLIPQAVPAADGAFAAFAPAKINLYLHILGRRGDGYHLIDSLIAFADIGDQVTAAPARSLSLSVAGPEAAALAETGDDNLVLRAARRLKERDRIADGAALHLDKQLPVASGIGGGSSDAAAALRALAALWGRRLGEADLAAWAALGADLPACLVARPLWAGGIGERIRLADPLPDLAVVLVNPRLTLPTAAVFHAWSGGRPGAAEGMRAIPRSAAEFAVALAACRNDLTDAAVGLMPEIGAVLDRLARLPGVLVARMSGSGATCFALFADRGEALRGGAAVAAAEPGWWVRTGALLTAAGEGSS
jgi:4-diphosphocytidyl-2-C-methyl-D-erythritol kinase